MRKAAPEASEFLEGRRAHAPFPTAPPASLSCVIYQYESLGNRFPGEPQTRSELIAVGKG